MLKEKEGLSVLLLGGGKEVLFSDALAAPEGEKVLVGEYAVRWPLVKILDIGGNLVHPRFPGHPPELIQGEVPPIPLHVCTFAPPPHPPNHTTLTLHP